MMFAAYGMNTMRGARQFVPDEGLTIVRPRRREHLIEISRRWQAEQEAKKARKEAFREMIAAASRKHRRTRPFEPGNRGSPVTELIARVGAWHGITAEEIRGRSRTISVAAARFDAIAAVYLNCRIDGRQYSLPELGRTFERDHTSVLYALQRLGLKPCGKQARQLKTQAKSAILHGPTGG